MNEELSRQPRTIIRIGRHTLTLGMPAANEAKDITLEPYTVKSGMSMAANLREAFRESVILTKPNNRVLVMIDTPVLLIPLEEYNEDETEAMFLHTYPDHEGEAVMAHVMPDLHCVAAFSINKDTKMVITDHFSDARFMPIMVPVWQHLHKRSYTGQAHKMYVFFHEQQLTIFSFTRNRFAFCNTFDAKEMNDCMYFILNVWQHLVMDQLRDELYIVGDMEEADALRTELKRFVQNVFPINPSAEYNRAPVTQQKNVTYDIVCQIEN